MKTWGQFIVGKNRTIFNKPHGQFQDGHVEVALTEEGYKQIQRDAIDSANEAAIKWFNNRPELTTVGLANAILSIKP